MEVDLRGLLGEAPARADRHRGAPFPVAGKIAVLGTSGSGKTTVSSELARRLGVPHVELDSLFHGPDWTPAKPEEFRRRVLEAIAGDGWVVDGNYSALGDVVLERADIVVWLDVPLRICLRRLWFRTSDRVRNGRELWNGNRESWRGAFWGRESLFVWTVRSHLRRKRTLPPRIAGFPHVRLRGQRAVDEWLESLDGTA